jgi:hypothetical protein
MGLGIGTAGAWDWIIHLSGLEPDDLSQVGQNRGLRMNEEQKGNRLTKGVSDCTNTSCMGRPRKPKNLRRSARFFLRLTPGEMARLEQASRTLGEPVAAIFRKGADLYIQMRGRGGSRSKGGHKQ